jgi:hypothetical protein
MSQIKAFLSTSTQPWHKLTSLQRLSPESWREDLNALYLDKQIEIRNGLNEKVIRWIKKI